MKKIALIMMTSLLFLSCEKENNEILIGKWRLVAGFNVMAGGNYNIPAQHQRFEEFTKQKIRIQSDLSGNEISRCNYFATNSMVTLYGKENNGHEWSFSYNYWFQHDTLAINHDGGFEFYNEYFIRAN